jgi:hypothetical protein
VNHQAVVAAAKQLGEVTAASVTFLTVIKVLPAITAVLAIMWYAVGFVEKITGKPFSETRFAKSLSGKKKDRD